MNAEEAAESLDALYDVYDTINGDASPPNRLARWIGRRNAEGGAQLHAVDAGTS